MRKSDLSWYDALDALYGTKLDDHQIEVWQVYLRELKTNNAEMIEAIEKAAGCDLKPKEWRVTVTDLTRWVKALRSKRRADEADPRMIEKAKMIENFKVKARVLFADGFDKDYLIDEAWASHGLTDDEIKGIVAWIEEIETK